MSSSDEEENDYEYQSSDEDVALACDLLFRLKLPPTPSSKPDSQQPTERKKAALVITSVAWDARTQRLYYGLNSGDVCFWPLRPDGVGAVRYVGFHKGPVTCICIPRKEEGELGASGLILSGSVDGNIKIWDYQGKVMLEPTVCVQTLYGHTGTITGIFPYDTCIVSSSTDKTVKVWKAVEGRAQLVYPWYDLQVRAWRHAQGMHTCVHGQSHLQQMCNLVTDLWKACNPIGKHTTACSSSCGLVMHMCLCMRDACMPICVAGNRGDTGWLGSLHVL